MSVSLIITLCVLVLMVVSFVLRKVKYGLIVMTCVAILALTGVIDIKTALSGFSNTTTLLVATMLVLGTAVGRTNVANSVRRKMEEVSANNNRALLLAIAGATLVLSILIGQTAVMCIMFVFVATLDEDEKMSPGRMIFLVCAINEAWWGRVPIGIGASMPALVNGYYSGLVTDASEQLGMFDILLGGIIPAIVLTLYSLIAWPLFPSHPIDRAFVSEDMTGKQETMSSRDEILTFTIFGVVLVGFLFSQQIGEYQYIIPICAVLALFYFKIMSLQDIVKILTNDMVWMIAGMTVVSAALGSSGASELIGNGVLAIVGDRPDPFFFALILSIAVVIPATFTSHLATMAVMVPIAVSIAQAAGMDPVPVAIIVYNAAMVGIGFPSGNTGSMIAFGVSQDSPAETLKFILPYMALGIVSSCIAVPLLMPLY